MGHSILQPKPLNEWLKLLAHTALPVHAGQKERVQRVMSKADSSLGEISQVISEAPSIALILFREANQSKNSLADPAHSLDAVLKRLGMTRCTRLLASLMDESQLPIPTSLRQIWLMGQHANRQANALFAHKMARLWQEIHWGSLLFFSPLWPLLTRHPEFLELWEQRVLGNQEPAVQVELELLGVPLIKLCHTLAKHWCLPRWIIEGYATLDESPQMLARALQIARLDQQPLEQQRRLDAQADLAAWLGKPANSIVLATGLALASQNSWGDNRCLRWQRLISLYMRQPLPAIQQKIHQTSVEHARYIGPTNLWHPACALLWPWSERRARPETKAAATTTMSRATADDSRLDREQWSKQAQLLIASPSPFRNTLQLLSHYALMLQHGAFSRVLILRILHSSNSLVPVCQLNYQFALQKPLSVPATNPVFRHVLRHPEHLHVHAANQEKILPLLGDSLLAKLDSRELLIGSVHHHDKPLLLVIADDFGRPLHEKSRLAFSAGNQYLAQALALWKG